MRYFILLTFIFLFACSNDTGENNTVADTGADLTADVQSKVDANSDVTTTDDVSSTDVGIDAVDDVTADTSTDATGGADAIADTSDADPGPDYSNRPAGQCDENSDCPVGPQGQMCSIALPGGTCLGCGDDDDCPNGTECSMFGSCNTTCTNDDECPPGLGCSARGLCGAERCVNGACPVAWFSCNGSNRCERMRCDNDPNVCPSGTTCQNNWCIEDHLDAP